MVLYKRSGRFQSFPQESSLRNHHFPGFLPNHKFYSGNPGTVAMGSTIRLRVARLMTFKFSLYSAKVPNYT
ncbi:hypothetical protein [Paenibacillus sp. 1-18]|uniref:hypothetical protein n=1 Tax=Paenibacillus sp. 1-18 TaxID=1333846 RepID=UPI000470B3B0|nr:hypothetical protein [Paenibacillus sp. 1-18]